MGSLEHVCPGLSVIVVRLLRNMGRLQFSDPYRTASSPTGGWSVVVVYPLP